MRVAVIVSIAAFFITGCVTAPPLPRIESSRGDRVGILVEIGNEPAHSHIGTTVFNNFSKKYPYDWNLRAEVTRTVEQSVRESGLAAVDLRLEGFNYSDVAGLVQGTGTQWQVAPGKEEAVRRLREQHRLKAVLVLKDAPVIAAVECSGGPCAERYVNSSGLYSRSFFGMTRYHAVAAFQWNLYVLDPAADASNVDPLRSILRVPATSIPGFKEPANFENLTEAEFAPVREAVLRFTGVASKEAVKALNTK